MRLLTKEIEKNIPALYEQDGKGEEAIVYALFFCPENGWIWYITEYDPEERLAFGLVKGWETEWGYISIAELEESGYVVRVPGFKPTPFNKINLKVTVRGVHLN